MTKSQRKMLSTLAVELIKIVVTAAAPTLLSVHVEEGTVQHLIDVLDIGLDLYELRGYQTKDRRLK